MLGYSHFVHSMTRKWGRVVVLQVWSVTSITQVLRKARTCAPWYQKLWVSGSSTSWCYKLVLQGNVKTAKVWESCSKGSALWCWARTFLGRPAGDRTTGPSVRVAFPLPCRAMHIFAICLRSSEFKRSQDSECGNHFKHDSMNVVHEYNNLYYSD